ncbi:hypothetical protein ACJU26_15225 [Acidithiobacillus sp. M4-SHS-6]
MKKSSWKSMPGITLMGCARDDRMTLHAHAGRIQEASGATLSFLDQ